MNERPALELRRPRKLDQILGDGLSSYGQAIWVLLGVSAAIVIPANAIVNFDSFGRGYQEKAEVGRQIIDVALGFLVISPLVTAMAIHVLREQAENRKAGFLETMRSGFDAFAPLFVAVLIAGVGIALGLFALIVPGIFVAVRWLFVAQAVVIEKKERLDALALSTELTRGLWWRTAGVALAVNLCAIVPTALLALPLEAGADAADADALSLVGTMLGQIVAAPFVALCITLLYFDLVARKAGVSLPGPSAPQADPDWTPPPPPVEGIPRDPGPPPDREPGQERPPDPPGLPPRDPQA
ncbi:MAG: hypothetical protein H0V29_00365 [Thermoleophilaceae bacterium]|nr:hypothetical protein [Thermoleophilaceae bacterium]